MHCLVRAVGSEDGATYMLLHLPLAQRAWSASSLLALQRLRRPVPAAVPALDGLPPSSHSMARSEGGEGMSGGVGRVLEEDGVLGIGAELLHGGVRERERGWG